MQNTIHPRPMIILLLFFALPVVHGQNVDHIYLKSGSMIRGRILEIEPANHVKIEDLCGNIWYYDIAQVEKITSEPYTSERFRQSLAFSDGFVNITSIGFLAGSSSNSQSAPFSLQTVNGWRNSLGLFTGVGVGVEFLSTNYLPLFLDLRYDLFGSDVVPYLIARGGYAFPLAADHEEYDISYTYSGGAMAGVGAGVKIKTRTHFAWDIELMYRYQKTAYEEKYDWNNQVYDYTDIYNRIEIRLGFYID